MKLFFIMIKIKIPKNLFKALHYLAKHGVISTFLTILAGLFIAVYLEPHFQEKFYNNQRRTELFRFELEKKDEISSKLSRLINDRYLHSQRALEAPDNNQIWTDYRNSVTNWNLEIEEFRKKTLIYFNEDLTIRLIDEGKDINSTLPRTIHYKFYQLNKLIESLKSERDIIKIKNAQKLLFEISKQKDDIFNIMVESVQIQNRLLE